MHPSSTLYYREGSSDKVYQCAIEPSSNNPGYHVMFAYGRRGSTLTYGRKNDEPLPLPEATKVYEKLVREKMAKGYKAAAGAPVPAVLPQRATNPKPPASPMLPMLLNSITEAEAMKLLSDEGCFQAWCLQEKHDGRRLQVRVHGNGQCDGFNKLGKYVPVPPAIHAALQGLESVPCVLDGEAVADDFHIFDLLELNGRDLRPAWYQHRLQMLWESAIGTVTDSQVPGSPIKLVDTFYISDKKRAFDNLTKNHAEGAVFKQLLAPWSAGRPNSGGDALKFKFVETASFIVEKVNAKRSVELALLPEPEYQGGILLRKCVGNVTIPPNKTVPAPGAIVEVRYLYAYRGGSIYQPVYLGERDDVERSECHTGQLKYKAA